MDVTIDLSDSLCSLCSWYWIGLLTFVLLPYVLLLLVFYWIGCSNGTLLWCSVYWSSRLREIGLWFCCL